MTLTLAILNALSSKQAKSGAILAEKFGVSRTAIWKHIQFLRKLGVEIEAEVGTGYRLHHELELLNEDHIRAHLAESNAKFESIECQWSIDSTNTFLLARRSNTNSGTKFSVCFAEHQSAGRGRRGRAWVSPLGANLYFSISREFSFGLSQLSGLSIVVGIALVEALRSFGVKQLGLKWPNDVVTKKGKLAGVLIEADGEVQGPSRAIVGVGLNLRMTKSASNQIDQAWVDFEQVCAEAKILMPSRNLIAARLLEHLAQAMDQFSQTQLKNFETRFAAIDVLHDHEINVLQAQQQYTGFAKGLDAAGNLLVQTPQGMRTCHSGEVSVRIKT